VFSHIALTSEAVPANQALLCRVDASLGRPPHHLRNHKPGCPRNMCLEQIHWDSGTFPADLCCRAFKCRW